MEKFIATIRGIVVVAVFLLLPLVPPVGVDEASAQSACQLAIDAALDACGAADEAINGPIGSMDDLEEALDLLELCLDQVDDVLRFCDPS